MKKYKDCNKKTQYGVGGAISGIGSVASAFGPIGAVVGGVLGGIGNQIQGDEQKKLAFQQKMIAGQLQADTAQSAISNPYQAVFADGGRIAVAPQIEMLPPNQQAVYYNQLFGPMANQLDRIQNAGEANKNMKVAIMAGMGTHDLNNYKEDPVMVGLGGKTLSAPTKQTARVQNFVNSLTQDQINGLAAKYPKDGSIGDKLSYVRNIGLKPNQFLGALDAWSFKNRNKFPMGGEVGMTPVELEKQEVFQTPDGMMGQVNGPSHEQGGVDMNLPGGSFVWSDKLKTSTGKTFADEAAKLAKDKAKYEKILNS